MPADPPSKVTAAHLRKDAYLYVRQSTIKQVLNNTESALRQYDLKSRAIALGWSAEQVIVIDIDQGQSGASAADRDGFQRLVAEVGMGRAGIVLGLECSRLARNNALCLRRHKAFYADLGIMPTSSREFRPQTKPGRTRSA
jgi:DNA invertase Pin-like site-specific DNA recombinase